MSESSDSQPLLSPEDAADASAVLPPRSNFHGGHATTLRSARTLSQTVLFSEEDALVAENTPPPPPLPGEIATKRRVTRSSARAGKGGTTPRQGDPPATPITPNRPIPTTQRTDPQPTGLARASPNRYTPLEEVEISDRRAEAPEAASPPLNSLTHGWNSFVNSLGAEAQRDLGVIDDILISYANFAGEAFRAFDVEATHGMSRILALEQSMDTDRDDNELTKEAIAELDKTVAHELSDIRKLMFENATMLKKNMSQVEALQGIVDANATQVTALTAALSEVTETANSAFRLASKVEPTIIGYSVKLDALEDNVSKISSDIDGLRASYAPPPDNTTKLTLLESTVSRMGSDFVELRKILEAQSGSHATGESTTMPPTDMSASGAPGTTRHTSTQGVEDVHPLFPDADPEYRRPRETQVPAGFHTTRPQVGYDRVEADDEDSVGGSTPPRQAAQGFRSDSRRPTLRPVPPLQTSHRATSNAPPHHIGTMRQPLDDYSREDGGRDDDDEDSLGGMIVSPRNADRRRQALAQKISPFDVARLGNVRYHGGTNGYHPLTASIIHRCGYTEIHSSDVLLAYNDIIEVHSHICDNWEHPRGHYKGPQLERILEKGISSFPRLTGFEVEQMVEFYDAFHKTALIYLLPVTPFDCISIKMGFEALCPPGLGIPRYAQISRVLMEVLPRLLPRSDTQISTLINMVRMESGNGFDLLWRVMALSVPGFDPTRQVTIPMWDDADIFDFALAFLLYFRLLAKKGVVQDDRTNSISFLNAITEPAYADTITTLMTCITNYASGLDDGYLPPNLCIMGLATQLHTNARTRAQAVVPRVRRTLGMYMDEGDRGSSIQGSLRAARLAEERHERPPYRDGRAGRGGSHMGVSRPLVQGGRGTGRPGRPPPTRGRFTRPDRNDGPYRPDTVCDACRRTGHVAANCDVLAIALFIEKYKRDLSDDVKDKIESEWVARWRSAIGNPKRPPRRVMKTYLDLLDLTVDELDDQMCWDCWPEDVDVNDYTSDMPSE